MHFPTQAALLVALIVALTAGCAPAVSPGGSAATASAPSAPKNIVVISSGDPPSLDLRFFITSNNAVRGPVPLYESALILFNRDDDTRKPQLAEAVPSLDNGLWKLLPDSKMETRITIKAGAKWHDGVPITTRDIIFSDAVYLDKTLPQITSTVRNYVDRITAVDEKTVVVNWSGPFIMADGFSPSLMPAHILEPAFRENPQSLANHSWLGAEYIGNGPFKLKHFEPGSHMILTAFDQYVLGRPKLDEIELKFIPDPSTMLANMLAGAGDLTMSSSTSLEQAYQLQTQGWDGQIGANDWSAIHFYVQYIDPVNEVLTDKRFRKGLMFAQDRQAYVDSIQRGFGGVVDVPLLPTDPNYQTILAQVERYPFDPRRAAEMFAQVGLAKGPDGYLRFSAPGGSGGPGTPTQSGQRLEQIEFRTGAAQDVQVRLLPVMSDDFKNVGLDIKQVVIPAALSADRVYRVTFPGFQEASGGPLGPESFIGLMHSSKVPTPANNYTSGNYPRYSNPQWDALIDKFAVTIPAQERLQVLTDVIKHLQDNLMDVSFIYSTHPQFASKRMAVPKDKASESVYNWDIR